MYAGLDDVIEMSKTVCAKHGFSIAFNEGVTEIEDHIRLCATVLHKDGHKEPYHYDVPIGGVGIKGVVNMTAIHAKATSCFLRPKILALYDLEYPNQRH